MFGSGMSAHAGIYFFFLFFLLALLVVLVLVLVVILLLHILFPVLHLLPILLNRHCLLQSNAVHEVQ